MRPPTAKAEAAAGSRARGGPHRGNTVAAAGTDAPARRASARRHPPARPGAWWGRGWRSSTRSADGSTVDGGCWPAHGGAGPTASRWSSWADCCWRRARPAGAQLGANHGRSRSSPRNASLDKGRLSRARRGVATDGLALGGVRRRTPRYDRRGRCSPYSTGGAAGRTRLSLGVGRPRGDVARSFGARRAGLSGVSDDRPHTGVPELLAELDGVKPGSGWRRGGEVVAGSGHADAYPGLGVLAEGPDRRPLSGARGWSRPVAWALFIASLARCRWKRGWKEATAAAREAGPTIVSGPPAARAGRPRRSPAARGAHPLGRAGRQRGPRQGTRGPSSYTFPELEAEGRRGVFFF